MLEMNLILNTNEAIQGTKGKYYPRVEYKGTIDTKELAKILSKHSTTFTAGEMIGVLTDAAALIKEKVLDGYVVKIEDLGLFKASVDGNGLTLRKDAKVSSGVGVQRKDEEIQANVAVQQCAIGCIKMIVQATGDTTISEMTKDGKTRFTSKAKDLIKKLTGNDADGDGGGDDNGSGNQSPEEGGEVMAPQISGNTPFTDSTQVTIQGPQGAHIYYTTNGSTPTQESQLYSEPLTLSQTATIKAIAVVEGVSSEVASKTFTKSSGGGGDNGSGLDMG